MPEGSLTFTTETCAVQFLGDDKIHILFLLFYQSNEACKVVTHTPAPPKDTLGINAAGLFDFFY